MERSLTNESAENRADSVKENSVQEQFEKLAAKAREMYPDIEGAVVIMENLASNSTESLEHSHFLEPLIVTSLSNQT